MNCSDVQQLLSAYFDKELADDARSNVGEHLDECSECSRELAAFENLSVLASDLHTPAPPDHLWQQIAQQLDRHADDGQPVAEWVGPSRHWSSVTPRLFALAATVFVAVGIGWFSYHSWFAHGEHDQFAIEFGHYLDVFSRDPNAAQQILLAKYENRLVDPNQVIGRIGYRPAVADGLPEGYTVESTHVVKMPCCTCVQSTCRRSDGSTLAVFEHDDEQTPDWFGDRPEITASCNDTQCCLVELDDQIAASWKQGTRHITLIGVRDVAEVSQMVAWLDGKRRPGPN